MVNFDNTPENAREILGNLGRNIDIVAGVFDETLLALRCCDAIELMRVPICCAVSIYHPLAQKKRLSVADLNGQRLMLMKRNWSKYVDKLRDELWEQHPEIQIVDFSFYSLEVFNQCEHENALLMAIPQWEGVHPLLKILPVDWDYSIPFGLLHAPVSSPTVQRLMDAVTQVMCERQKPKG